MMWIFEWDILTGDSAVLDVISSVTGDRVDEAVAEGHEAVAAAERMRDPRRRHRLEHLARPGDARGLPRHPRLRGRHPAAARRVPRARAAPGAVARHRVGAGPHASGPPPWSATGRSRHPTSTATRATSTTRPTTSPPPSSASRAASATRRWPGWRAACSSLALGLARRRGAAARSAVAAEAPRSASAALLGRRHPPVARGRDRPGDAARAARAARRRARRGAARHPGRADLVPRPGAPARRPRRLAGAARRRLGAAARPGPVGCRRRGRRGRWWRAARWPCSPCRRPARAATGTRSGPSRAGAPSTSPSRWRCSCGCSWPPPGRCRSPGDAAGRRAPCSPRSVPGWRCRPLSSAVVGLERALTAWNDEVGLLPWGLSRILGITVYLGIPADTAWWAAGVGAVLLGRSASLLAIPGTPEPRRRSRVREVAAPGDHLSTRLRAWLRVRAGCGSTRRRRAGRRRRRTPGRRTCHRRRRRVPWPGRTRPGTTRPAR